MGFRPTDEGSPRTIQYGDRRPDLRAVPRLRVSERPLMTVHVKEKMGSFVGTKVPDALAVATDHSPFPVRCI